MPTVPRYGEQKVQQQPMPGPRVSISADDNTFGGGQLSKNLTASMLQLNETVQDIVKKREKANSVMASNVAAAEDKNQMMKDAYDPTPVKITYKDEFGKEQSKEVARGYMLRQGKDASLEGGAMGASGIGYTDQILNKRISSISDTDALYNYNQRVSTWKQALDTKMIEHEQTQQKVSNKADLKYTLEKNAADRIMPLEVKFQEAKTISAPFFAKDGIPQSEQEAVLEMHNYQAAASELDELIVSRTGTKASSDNIIRIAKEKGGISPEHVKDLQDKVKVKEIEEALANNERVVAIEEENMKLGLPGIISWKDRVFPPKTPIVKKAKQPVKRSSETTYDSYVKKINKDLPGVMSATTDNETLANLQSIMLDESISNEDKRLNAIAVLADKKINPDDWSKVSSLYFMKPEEKKFAAQGLRSVNDYVFHELGNNPDMKRRLSDDYLIAMESKKADDTVDEVYGNVIHGFNVRRGLYPANIPRDDAPQTSVQLQGGQKAIFQNTGNTKTSKKKADVTLAPKAVAPADGILGPYKNKSGKTYYRDKKGTVIWP
jgi:hypothetical protein